MIGSVTWIIDAAWGWSPNGWMVQLMGYHDAYASGVIHAIAGGTALAAVIVLGPRIGKFGPGGEIRDIKPHNVWLTCLGLFIIYTGFWGFYAACNVPILNVGSEGSPFFSATNIYLDADHPVGHHLQLPAVADRRDDGDVPHQPRRRLLDLLRRSGRHHRRLGRQRPLPPAAGPHHRAVVPVIAYKLHYYVERRFRLDDAVGAVAVHGYSGFLGVVIAGFLLWGYPAAPLAEGVSPWFTTAEGLPMINPIGNLLGAVIMFGVLGFLPAFALCKVLDRMGLLRVPRAVELAGLDTHDYGDAYPYFLEHETAFETLERTVAADLGPATLPGSTAARTARPTVRRTRDEHRTRLVQQPGQHRSALPLRGVGGSARRRRRRALDRVARGADAGGEP
jgi:hypothetical protein